MSMVTREFFSRSTLEVAPALIGAVLHVRGERGECSGRIVEVEAYLGESDPASHAGRGRTPRSEIMFGAPSVAYVYLIYGLYHCLNFVTEVEGRAGAVLIRAIEPLSGRDRMCAGRGLSLAQAKDRDLAAGPGKLCGACGIDLDWNGIPLGNGPQCKGNPGLIWLTAAAAGPARVTATPRIGIRQAVDRPYRFIDPASLCLSR
jgi:DNA-3-methyladenine glycosylase